jgi:hypothetical protein
MIFRAVERVCKSDVPNHPEIAKSSLKTGENSAIGIDSPITAKNPHEVHLDAGAKVEVTIRAKGAAIRPREPWPGTPDAKKNR